MLYLVKYSFVFSLNKCINIHIIIIIIIIKYILLCCYVYVLCILMLEVVNIWNFLM